MVDVSSALLSWAYTRTGMGSCHVLMLPSRSVDPLTPNCILSDGRTAIGDSRVSGLSHH
jgi:hypothetical protein